MESIMTSVIGAMASNSWLLAAEGKGFDPLDVGDWPLYFWTAIVFALLAFSPS